jgi:hypothetical protein
MEAVKNRNCPATAKAWALWTDIPLIYSFGHNIQLSSEAVQIIYVKLRANLASCGMRLSLTFILDL